MPKKRRVYRFDGKPDEAKAHFAALAKAAGKSTLGDFADLVELGEVNDSLRDLTSTTEKDVTP